MVAPAARPFRTEENLAIKGEPILLQLCVVPAYALTSVDRNMARICARRLLGIP